jgi:hypothetical protein
MKTWWLVCLLALAVCLPAIAQSQSDDYQAGKIVNVEKLAPRGTGGGTDAALGNGATTYHISIQVADTVYVCRYQAPTGEDLSWIQGKDVQVKIKGKKISVKRASGADAKASIISSSKAPTA